MVADAAYGEAQQPNLGRRFLAAAQDAVNPTPDCPDAPRRPLIPRITERFLNIYRPQPDIYTLQTVTTPNGRFTYTQGERYGNWRTNDHTFIKHEATDRWHCFGITKPWIPGDNSHHGEGLCFHAIAPQGSFDHAVELQVWQDLQKISVGDCGWAPHALKIGEDYTLIGSNLGRATSRDLRTWTDHGRLTVRGRGRDTNVLLWNGVYYLSRCAGNAITLMTSTDFENWADPIEIYKPPVDSYQTESPFIVSYKGLFYLFWTLWDQGDLTTSGYCPRTFVHCSESITDFHHQPVLTELTAHAVELVEAESGQWYISSADFPHCGVNVAPLSWG